VARYVLVHGAWLGGWSFGPLVRELEGRGHTVEAPDLPCEDPTKTAADYVGELGDCRDAIVVGHSLGGLTTALVDARLHVYVAGLLPVADVYRDAVAETFTGTMRDAEGRSYWPDLEVAAGNLFPDCSRADAEWAFPQLRRQAPIAVEPGPFDGVYVACLRDAAVRPEWQVAAAGRGLRVAELDAGHFPMIARPGQLADVLEAVDA
jgi:pimeloyl-ACP methyl ester carboxylesterase